MIEVLSQYIASEGALGAKVNRLREALQLLCLKIMQDSGAFNRLAFTGGTALRILYDMRRFSEDLDFSVIDKNGYDFSGIIDEIKRGMVLSGMEIEANTKVGKTVQASMIKFPGILKNLGLSAMASQKFSIKIEADSNPSEGWQVEDTVVNKIYLISIRHLTLSSLFAGKLHACFYRKYIKGRDFYDLIWYLGKRTKPNYELLNNAIRQTQGVNAVLTESNIKSFLLDRIEKIDFSLVKGDVERFLEDKSEIRMLDKNVITKSISDAF